MAHPQITRIFGRRSLLMAGSVASVLALAGGALVAGAAPAAAADTATINGASTFQTITGFGASEAFGQASSLMNAPYLQVPLWSLTERYLADLTGTPSGPRPAVGVHSVLARTAMPNPATRSAVEQSTVLNSG